MKAEIIVRACLAGIERAREEMRRHIVYLAPQPATSGPLPVGFDVARYTSPYWRKPEALRAWRDGFDTEVLRLAHIVAEARCAKTLHMARLPILFAALEAARPSTLPPLCQWCGVPMRPLRDEETTAREFTRFKCDDCCEEAP